MTCARESYQDFSRRALCEESGLREARRAPVREPRLAELNAEAWGNLEAMTNTAEAVHQSEVTFLSWRQQARQ